MHLTRLTSSKRAGFRGKPLHRHKERYVAPWTYLKEKSSFLIAAISIGAFVAGNMIGSHGMYAFWKSVWGKYDDSLIVYTGTVAPIAQTVDYGCVARLGVQVTEDYTWRLVPEDCKVPLPVYDASIRSGDAESRVYEVVYMGSYSQAGEGKGSHLGVDIASPKDTPVVAVANGVITSVREDKGGFGKIIVLRIPHAPDPEHPNRTIVLHAAYAHLNAQLVAEGDVVRKGQVIGLVGRTGYATGNHLHFQIDRDTTKDGEEVAWHPAWPFTAGEARDAGLSLAQAVDSGFHREQAYRVTINPMLYVQANYPAVGTSVAQDQGEQTSSAPQIADTPPLTMLQRLIAQRDARRQIRLARHAAAAVAVEAAPVPVAAPQPSSETVAVTPVPDAPAAMTASEVRTIEIAHDNAFAGRGWETITVTLRDAGGNPVDGGMLENDLYLRTAYGDAEFRPAVLSSLDFHGGRAEVQMLPRGRRTIVVTAQPFGTLSEPMRFEGK